MSDFIIRVFKGWNTTLIERAWSNSYEIMSAETDPTVLFSAAEAIVDAEKQIHLNNVNFLQYTISTWEPDSHPYDPLTFTTVPLVDIGLRGGGAGITTGLDYNICLVVKRGAHTGRVGRLFYRGCLLETDVRMGGDGRFIIDPADTSAFAAAFANYQTEMAPVMPILPGNQLALIGEVKGLPGTITRRPVTVLTLGGVTINKRNHKYFDKL